MTRIVRVFLPAAMPGTTGSVPSETAHRLAAVMRLSPGDALAVFPGDGREYAATVASASRNQVRVTIGEVLRQQPPPATTLELWPGLVRAQRMDLLVEKCTEAGADVFRPLVSEHAARGDEVSAARSERWQRIAVEAAEQSGRLFVPVFAQARRLAAALEGPRMPIVVGDPGGQSIAALAPLLPSRGALGVAIGPEGGFSAEELAAFRRAGALFLRLGPHILRTETAAIVATAMLRDALG